MSRFSKRDRAEAVDLLLCVADIYEQGAWFGFAPDLLDGNGLALRAWSDVTLLGTTMAEDALNAAALVRDGWCPGDEIVDEGGGR